MKQFFVCVCLFSQISFLVLSNPLDSSENNDIGNKSMSLMTESDKSIFDIINQIINPTQECVTGQGQSGHCTPRSHCRNLGNFSAVPCNKDNSFIICCPMEPTSQSYPSKVEGCGIRPILKGDLIVGGYEAIPHSWPWSVALFQVVRLRKRFICGATIINKKYILTAAHCVYSYNGKVNPENFQVKVGAHDLKTSGQFMKLENIFIHNKYSPRKYNNDIALLKLKTELSFDNNSYVAPICLPERNADLDLSEGTMVTMIGWGVHSQWSNFPSNTLYEVEAPIYNLDKCRKIYQDLTKDELDLENVICAGREEGGLDTCQGDSGGPMMVQKSDEYYQVGIVSFGYGCALKGYPGVYTNLQLYLGWIGSHMDFDSREKV